MWRLGSYALLHKLHTVCIDDGRHSLYGILGAVHVADRSHDRKPIGGVVKPSPVAARTWASEALRTRAKGCMGQHDGAGGNRTTTFQPKAWLCETYWGPTGNCGKRLAPLSSRT